MPIRTYLAVFSLEDRNANGPEYRTIQVTAASHNDMVAQVRTLMAPAGYVYIGTRDHNQWYHFPTSLPVRA